MLADRHDVDRRLEELPRSGRARKVCQVNGGTGRREGPSQRALEVLGALGLVLPAATGIATVLTPFAAAGLALTMVGAAVVHLRRDETSSLAAPIVLGALAVFVAVMRFGPNAF